MKEWEVLSDEERNYVWDQVFERFKFNPRYNSESVQFLNLPKPYRIYDMHLFEPYLKDKSLIITDEYYSVFNNCIQEVLVRAMGKENFMYALDWQHECFRYNPKINEKMPHTLETADCNIYFPDFYPDGDYYFFTAKDFSWGYFTHPWKQELWIFGDALIEGIDGVPSLYLTLKYNGIYSN